LREGLEVIGSDSQRIGQIKEVREREIVIGRTLQPAVAVPNKAIQRVTADGVVLSITGEQVDDRFWARAGEDADVDLSGSYD
jgi:hypothetical protein